MFLRRRAGAVGTGLDHLVIQPTQFPYRLHLPTMKPYLNLFAIMLALLASLYLGWRVTQPELVGHWHVHPAFQASKDVLPGIHHFNVYRSGEIRINEVLEDDYLLTGYVDKLLTTIHIGGGCLYVGFQYRIRGNQMELWYDDGEHSSWKTVAHRFSPGDCDPERDFFIGLPMDIQLPEDSAGQFESLSISNGYLTFKVGKDQINSKTRIIAGGHRELITKQDLREYYEGRMIKMPSRFSDNPEGIIIYKDSSVAANEVKLLLTDELRDISNLKGYYLAHRNPNTEGLALTYQWVEF